MPTLVDKPPTRVVCRGQPRWFAPLYRSSIGLDRMLDALETASRVETIDSWPPYDIAKTGEDDYRITMAIAGFSQDELDITQEQNMLLVRRAMPGAQRKLWSIDRTKVEKNERP